MHNADELRDVLLEYSDHQAVRSVFGDHSGRQPAALVDYVEAMRATDGAIALVASDGAAEIYARWDGRERRYEYLIIWPPWTIGGYDHSNATELAEFLEAKEHVRPMLREYTPFADQQALTGPSHHIWP
jgi:hypothetical protein